MNISIIGSGIFGLTVALILSKKFNVTVFESNSDILNGATLANHNRHHYGFHYPRSPDTVIQCQMGKKTFENFYPNVLRKNYENFYAISKNNSHMNFSDYCSFLDNLKLKYSVCRPPKLFNSDVIEGCVLADEGVYDYQLLRSSIIEKLKRAVNPIKIRLNSLVNNVSVDGEKKNVEYTDHVNNNLCLKFDVVIDCSYGKTNFFNSWLNADPRLLQYNLQELAVIEIPETDTFGATVMDGMFPSVLPYGFSNKYLFAHAELSQLIRKVSKNSGILNEISHIKSNWFKIKNESIKYLPILKKSIYHNSIFVERVVDHSVSKTDARISDLKYCGNNCWSIFSAKVITSVDVANKLLLEIENSQ
jgi:hypothetical protein